MKPEELRIGNWVTTTGIPEKVIGINGNLIFFNDETSCGIGYLFAIALTTEILEKVGFEKNFTDEDIDDSVITYWTKKVKEGEMYCDLAFISGDKNGFLEICLFPYEQWFRYKYVHQLQNLYYSLTRQELEFNF